MKYLDFSQQVLWTDFHGKHFICIIMQQAFNFLKIRGKEFPTAFSKVLKTQKGANTAGGQLRSDSHVWTWLLLAIFFLSHMLIPVVSP